MIAAMTKELVIGKNNSLPGWSIPGDMKRFKKITKGKVILMGRRTFESLGKPLPDRWNIVVSSTMISCRIGGIWVVRSLEEGLRKASSLDPGGDEVVIIGGGGLYEQALPMAERLYLTILDEQWEGDTFFPKLNKQDWIQVEREDHPRFSFFTYERVNSEQTKNYTSTTGTGQQKTMTTTYEDLGRSVGALVDVKNKAYGSAFDDAGEFLKLLYPDGIQPSQYADALALVRIFDKMKRIATDRDALGESPYRDIAGYGLLGLMRVERAKSTLQTALQLMESRYTESPENKE